MNDIDYRFKLLELVKNHPKATVIAIDRLITKESKVRIQFNYSLICNIVLLILLYLNE